MRGVTVKKTQSGYCVAKVHYSADPEKDPANEVGKSWLEKEIVGYMGGRSSSDWRKEMEIDFSVRSGEKVFPLLEQIKDKVFIKPHDVCDWWNFAGGYDWGKRNPFSYHDYCRSDSEILAVYEAYGSGFGIPAQAKMIKESPYWQKHDTRYADPSIWNEDRPFGSDYTSIHRLFGDEGVTFLKGARSDTAAVDRLEMLWFDVVGLDSNHRPILKPKESPIFKIFWTCPNLWDELINLRWADFTAKVEEGRGKKEEIAQVKNHAWDDLKYYLLSLPDEAIEPTKKEFKGYTDSILDRMEEQQSQYEEAM